MQEMKDIIVHYKNKDLKPHLEEGDTLTINDVKENQDFNMIVHKYYDEEQHQTKWSLQGQTIADRHPNSLLKPPLFEPDKAPIVVLSPTDGHSRHTKENATDVKKKIEAEYPNYHFKSILSAEQYRKHAVPNYPYKQIKPLTAPNKQSHANFKIVEGKVVDPDMIRKIDTDRIYYLKALRSFTASSDKTDYKIQKGQVSGPIILSANKDIAYLQLQALRQNANCDDPKKQNFWLDQKSSMQGNWRFPTHGLLVNSEVRVAGNDSSKGYAMDNAVLHNTLLVGHNNSSIAIVNSGIDDTKINVRQNKALLIDSSDAKACYFNTNQNERVQNSYLQATSVSGATTIERSIIQRNTPKQTLINNKIVTDATITDEKIPNNDQSIDL